MRARVQEIRGPHPHDVEAASPALARIGVAAPAARSLAAIGPRRGAPLETDRRAGQWLRHDPSRCNRNATAHLVHVLDHSPPRPGRSVTLCDAPMNLDDA